MFRNFETNYYLCTDEIKQNGKKQPESSIFGGSSFFH